MILKDCSSYCSVISSYIIIPKSKIVITKFLESELIFAEIVETLIRIENICQLHGFFVNSIFFKTIFYLNSLLNARKQAQTLGSPFLTCYHSANIYWVIYTSNHQFTLGSYCHHYGQLYKHIVCETLSRIWKHLSPSP